MQYIDKKLTMPNTVQAWIDTVNPQAWNELSYHNKVHYETLRDQLRQEQKGLCCYCCQILAKQVTIEHVKARKNFPNLTFDYGNLLLSCKPNPKIGEPIQCDKAKENHELDLTPLMKECDIEIKLNLNGELEWTTDRAKHAITLLNLNNKNLCKRRQDLIDNLYDKLLDLDLDFNLLNIGLVINAIGNTSQAELYRYIYRKLQANDISNENN